MDQVHDSTFWATFWSIAGVASGCSFDGLDKDKDHVVEIVEGPFSGLGQC